MTDSLDLLIKDLRNPNGIIKRSRLTEAADELESLQKENAFLKAMQRRLVEGKSEHEVGVLVQAALKENNG